MGIFNKIILIIILVETQVMSAQAKEVYSATKEVSRCKILSGDTYVDYKMVDHKLDLQLDKSECSNGDGKVKVNLEMRNVLYRGGMNAAIPSFGLYDKSKNNFVPFVLVDDEQSRSTYKKIQADFEKEPGSQDWKKQDRAWKLIGKTYSAKIIVGEYPCTGWLPAELKGQIWVSPKGVTQSAEKKPYANTFIVDWNIKKPNTEPEIDLTIKQSPSLCQSYQHHLPTSDTNKMQNGLFKPVGVSPCYVKEKSETAELQKNMNDIVSYFSRQPVSGDKEDANKLYNEYLNKSGIYIDKEAGD